MEHEADIRMCILVRQLRRLQAGAVLRLGLRMTHLSTFQSSQSTWDNAMLQYTAWNRFCRGE